ncbi:MAG: hypothetical protein GY861_13020 [bacterium]|nr:hypothetical protein [bacterium]
MNTNDESKTRSPEKNIKVGLVCDGSGHYAQLSSLEEAFEDFEYFYMTIENIVTKERKDAYLFKGIELRSRLVAFQLPLYLLNVVAKTLRVFFLEKPQVLVSTGGSGFAIPVFYIGKILGMKLIFIETASRVEKRSLTGKILSPVVDRIFVRHPELLKAYGEKAEFHGRAV